VWSNEEITPEKIEVYHWLLGDFAFDAVMAAVKRHMTSGTFFPKPAELLALLSEREVPAISPGEAFAIVQKQINRHGADGFANVTFDDPAVSAAVQAVGWKRICLEDRSKADYVMRDFTAALEREQRSVRLAVQDGTAAIGGGNVTALDRRAS
jgi:hypothetical protein